MGAQLLLEEEEDLLGPAEEEEEEEVLLLEEVYLLVPQEEHLFGESTKFQKLLSFRTVLGITRLSSHSLI